MHFRFLPLVCSLVACFATAGCDSAPVVPEGVSVSGKVLLPEGGPLTGGTLIFRPEGGLHGGTALIGSDGSFAMGAEPAGAEAGMRPIVPGKYQVFVIFPNPAHASLAGKVNKRYQESDYSDSDVVVEIEQATSDLVIKLKR